MKKLIFLTITLALLAGCTNSRMVTKNPEPAFTFGQHVQIQSGFFKNISGYVTGYTYCLDNNEKSAICYNVQAVIGFTIMNLDRPILESNLAVVQDQNQDQ